ncbi:Tyrosinase [Smittium culicis]|uniref:Tyrosinase n=1 Tax=Smittium culicis TaxID=133412 RepID=A0A1R1YEJ2_9FUNG|nr:Tyrosinase [Smittium culicis]
MMFNKLLACLSLSVIIGLFRVQGQSQTRCSSTVLRREVRSLSRSDWQRVTRTVTTMYNNGWFHWFSFIHNQQFANIHNVANFLPFHRRFVVEFELVGKTIDPNFAVPFWDATIDFANPAGSPVLTGNFIGGNGVLRGSTRCITNGFENGWIMRYPNNRCLSRNFNGNNGRINPWHSPESVTSVIQTSQNFQAFASAIELGIHADVHNGIGGDMSTGFSPNDFAFMLHHSNIDRIWTQWQNLNQGRNTNAYGGTNRNGSGARLSDNLPVFGETVQSVMRVGYGRNCYSYANSGARSSNRKRQESNQSNVNLQGSVLVNSTVIDIMLSIPDMSLATSLSQSAIRRFYPKLLEPETSIYDVALPNYVSINSLNYARKRRRYPNARLNRGGRNGRNRGRNSRWRIYNNGRTPKPLIATTLSGSLVLTSNKIDLKNNVPVNATALASPDSQPAVGASDDYNQSSKNALVGANSGQIIDAPAIPYPAKLSKMFLDMHKYDYELYNKLYAAQVLLVDTLNNEGYVSPYL